LGGDGGRCWGLGWGSGGEGGVRGEGEMVGRGGEEGRRGGRRVDVISRWVDILYMS